MRKIKITLVVALAVGLAVAFAPRAWAFHDNGVAHCNGCHTMHNSYQGAEVSATVGDHLLKGETASDACLNCHGRVGASYSVFTGTGIPTAPQKNGTGAGGGDFVFLLEDGLNDGHGAATSIPGERAGHNIVAPSKGLAADTTILEAPGGGASAYSSADLGCQSCHEPHGGINFRFLHHGTSKNPPDQFSGVGPIVVAAVENSQSSTEGPTLHTAYVSGVSTWCGACHGDFHDGAEAGLLHPSGETAGVLGDTIAGNYNAYCGTDEPDGCDAYLAMVPVAWDAAAIDHTGDVPTTAHVMCLTCHRAHASSGPSSGRWDFNISEWLEEGDNSGSYPLANPYPAAGDHQRSLCNKCHVKDAGDSGL